MREPHSISAALLTALLLAVLPLGACASKQAVGNAAATYASTAGLRDNVATARTQMQQLRATLLAADQPETLNGTKWFKSFTRQHKDLRKSSTTLRENTQQYGRNRQAYLQKWDQDLDRIQQPELRAASALRRDSLRASLRDVSDGLETISQNQQPLLRTLGDLQTFLVNDLTPVGFTQARPQMVSAYDQLTRQIDLSSETLDLLNGLTAQLKPAS